MFAVMQRQLILVIYLWFVSSGAIAQYMSDSCKSGQCAEIEFLTLENVQLQETRIDVLAMHMGQMPHHKSQLNGGLQSFIEEKPPLGSSG